MAGEEVEEGETMVVECTECLFREVVPTDGAELPADIMRAHGRETGHQLEVSRIDE